MGHEVSKTFKVGKKWYNASSINPVTKKEMSEDRVRRRVVTAIDGGCQKPHSVHATHKAAIAAAKKRSKSFDKTLLKKHTH